ncbi:uncharacterized protein CLBA1 isoform X2 [Eublepharis macularius]|uniref:Uncharacterized protein CLBA1 isoform X2 n=1 Tax=Eublepharis macularius TaxID=481883 RepID=A0AA97IV46_EUBMA|nr:uncharacterized protein CLBA1 isoform X2 [Eublepharis macularius]
MLRRRQATETRSSSLPETGEGADRDHFGQNRKLNGLFELEVVQESLPGRDGDGGNYDATPDSFPDAFAGEASSTWGDFKGFSEVKLENLSHIPESLENLNGEQASTNDTDVSDNHGTTSCGQIFPRTAEYSRRDVFPNVPLKASLSPEEVIKRSFPEIPVPQFLENIGGLNQMLDTQTEEVDIPEHTKMQLCTDSGIFWKTLNHARNPSGLRCPWNESHCQENLLAVLGIDAHQKILSECKDDVLEKSNIKENEDSSADKFSISKALIQTKLSVSPDPRQSHLFTYNLFLKKTPSTGNMQYITVPQKKRIFTTQSLKMKMFSSNVC